MHQMIAKIPLAIFLLDMSRLLSRDQRQYEQPGIKQGAKVTAQARRRMSEARKGKTHSAGNCFHWCDS